MSVGDLRATPGRVGARSGDLRGARRGEVRDARNPSSAPSGSERRGCRDWTAGMCSTTSPSSNAPRHTARSSSAHVGSGVTIPPRSGSSSTRSTVTMARARSLASVSSPDSARAAAHLAAGADHVALHAVGGPRLLPPPQRRELAVFLSRPPAG